MLEFDSTPSELEIVHAFEMFLPKLQSMMDEYYAGGLQSPAPLMRTTKGSKYWKVICEHSSFGFSPHVHVYAFIRRSDGAILGSSSWSQPRLKVKKPICGYITDDNCLECFSCFGVIPAKF
jgi:hypothetical protein